MPRPGPVPRHSSKSIAPPANAVGADEDPRVPPRPVESERGARLWCVGCGAHRGVESERVGVERARTREVGAIDVDVEDAGVIHRTIRAVCADRRRWEHPTRWRARHLRDRPEMTEPTEARFGLLQARLPVAEPRRGIGIEAGAQRSDPHPRLTQRDRHLVAPPFGRAPSQRGHRAERAEVPGDVVARRGGDEARAGGAALCRRDPGRGLRHLFPPGTRRPRTRVAIASDVDVHEPRVRRGEVLGAEAAARERARPVALHEHVRAGRQRPESRRVLGECRGRGASIASRGSCR